MHEQFLNKKKDFFCHLYNADEAMFYVIIYLTIYVTLLVLTQPDKIRLKKNY